MSMNLDGIRVIELTHWVAGPLAGQILGEWGLTSSMWNALVPVMLHEATDLFIKAKVFTIVHSIGTSVLSRWILPSHRVLKPCFR